ncbi:MAG: response regulator transcription factor [Lachnospiraceae bacterium]|nr:response regulator transcription factor [Lachnospiraceae bacterium]
MKYKILILEDDKGIAEAIAKNLTGWDMEPGLVSDFRDVMGAFASFAPQLVLIDIGLPFMDGYHWCSEIRRISSVPIIFISSASDNMNIVMAMNMGADDFIAKPFDQSVLVAKIQALLRRSYDYAGTMPLLEHKGAFLNTGSSTLSYENEIIELSKNEYRILLTLMQNKDRVVSREKLMEVLWQTDSYVDENTLTVNIGRLRKKLSGIGLNDFIITKFGVGYMVKS